MTMPAELNLEWYRGDDYVHELTFEDDQDPPELLNLTGYTFKAQVRDQPAKGTLVLAEFDIDTTNADTGKVVISLAASDTSIPPGFWDLQVNDGTVTQTWFKGTVTPSGDVTQEDPGP